LTETVARRKQRCAHLAKIQSIAAEAGIKTD
jgi:hypothetical protein